MSALLLQWLKPAPNLNPKRWRALLLFLAVLFVGVLLVLGFMWYGREKALSFHLFDDRAEWLFMDKLGHALTTYYIARAITQLGRWAGLSHKKAKLNGVVWSFSFYLCIEFADGFMPMYGFSVYDIMANVFGCLLLYYGAWVSRFRFMPKYSFWPSQWAIIRPSLLGQSIYTQWLKDYNGQTYWFSFRPTDIISLLKLPSWLMISIGYGVDGVLGGHDNEWLKEGEHFDYTTVARSREWYLSFDIDFSTVYQKGLLGRVLAVLSFAKVPLPALGWSLEKGLRWYWIKF